MRGELLEVIKRVVFLASLAASATACAGNPTAKATTSTAPAVSDEAIASEFLKLELSGWRLPDPVGNCRKDFKLELVKAKSWGNYEGKVDTVEFGPKDPEPRVVSVVAADSTDPTLRKAFIEGSAGGKKVEGSFVFVRNRDPQKQGWGTLRAPPSKVWVRKGCR